MNSRIVELFCDTAHRKSVPTLAEVRVGVAAVEIQVPRVGKRGLVTAPVATKVTTAEQRALAAAIPVAGGRQ